jgi:hypothetical protein
MLELDADAVDGRVGGLHRASGQRCDAMPFVGEKIGGAAFVGVEQAGSIAYTPALRPTIASGRPAPWTAGIGTFLERARWHRGCGWTARWHASSTSSHATSTARSACTAVIAADVTAPCRTLFIGTVGACGDAVPLVAGEGLDLGELPVQVAGIALSRPM